MPGCEPESEMYERWESRATTGTRLRSVDGTDILVLSRGERNDGPGPDYRDAVLIIGGELRVGAVEMHRHERDWFAHGHDRDDAYGAVILHVVRTACKPPALAVPTVLEGSIDAVAHERVRSAVNELSRDLLVECSWTRLLRRVTEIVRSETGLPIEQRLARAFVRRLFDALGYSANRRPMRRIAEALLQIEPLPSTFDAIAGMLAGLGGCDPRIVRGLGALFMSDDRLERIIATRAPALPGIRWNRSTRPANVPERRLWAAARLLVEMKRERKLGRLLERIAAGGTWHQIERDLVVRFASQTFIGEHRAAEIIVNALLPVALAAGILRGSTPLIEGACRLYRAAPAQESNRILRSIEERFLAGRVLKGGFWQQGAIELHQRYLSPDRASLTYVAERRSVRYRLAAV
jgi:hypothetical protein